MKFASTAIKRGRETAVEVLPLSAVPGFDPENPPDDVTFLVPDEVEIGWVRRGGAWYPPPPPTPEENREAHRGTVEQWLDTFAQSRDFRDMEAACSFVTSNVPGWRADALFCVDLRDRVWLAFYAALDAQPGIGLADLLAQLPTLEWPQAD